MVIHPRAINLILLGLAIGLALYVRLGPVYLPIAGTMAETSVKQGLVQEAQEYLDRTTGQLPRGMKARVMTDLLAEGEKLRRPLINERIREKYKEFKSYWQDETGHTFLLEADPYHWYRLVKNLVERGDIGDTRIGNIPYDSFMLAPRGMKMEIPLHQNLHVYASSALFKIARFFNKDAVLGQVFFYVPLVVISLALLSIFFMCSSLGRGPVNIAGFIAAMALGFSPVLLERSLAGWSDTDGYIMLFSVFSPWMFYLSLAQEASAAKRIVYALLAATGICLFSFTWEGWWYIFYLLVLSSLYHMANLELLRRKGIPGTPCRKHALTLGVFTTFSLISIGGLCGPEVLVRGLSAPLKIISAKSLTIGNIWPNAFITVNELRKTSPAWVINNVCGMYLFFLSIAGLWVMYYDKKIKQYLTLQFLCFLLVFWIVSILAASLQAGRFTLLLCVPVAVSLGQACTWLFWKLKRLPRRLARDAFLKYTVMALCVAVPAGALIYRGLPFRNNVPLMNRYWNRLLLDIKEKTPANAIINGFWDYGHWIKAVAQRRVLFDGATQDTPLTYWVARAMVTDSEEEAVAILRMLNNGGNAAFELLDSRLHDPLKSVTLLKKLIAQDPGAQEALAKLASTSTVKAVLDYLYKKPAPAYFIVEDSLRSVFSSITFFGNWDFAKAYLVNNPAEQEGHAVSYLNGQIGVSLAQARQLYRQVRLLHPKETFDWVSARFNFRSDLLSARKENGIVLFEGGLVVIPGQKRAYVYSAGDKIYQVPQSLIVFKDDSFEEVVYPEANLPYSVLFFDDGGLVPKALLLDRALAKSMYVRLYFLGGQGLKVFKPFLIQEDKFTGRYYRVFMIDWEHAKTAGDRV